MSLRRLVDLVERRDEPATDPLQHVIGVALHHGGEALELLARARLLGGLHRAEHALRVGGDRLQR